jgi:lipoprotein-anchoring transpeptidase ErfK/SrfK
VASIPEDYAHKAQLPSMAYTSVTEMLGEKFHIDENYLKEINPGVNFNQPGSVVKVPNLGKPVRAKVARIIADKGRKQVRGYDESGKLVVAYPSTIGSSDNPSPSGIVQVERIAINPNYTYNPKINFKQGNNDKVLTIPPGPNGPVGTVWIALSKPTYGIHGTPEPSKIGKTSSHGCVRLTNWDAEELAKLVKAGVTVEFSE